MAASRKIEVQLVGDAGDLERSLAGALASLKAFGSGAESTNTRFAKSTKTGERALFDFDHAAAKVNKTMSGGPFGLFDAIGNVGYAILKFGGIAQGGAQELDGLESTGVKAFLAMNNLESVFGGLVPVLAAAVGGLAAFGAALLVLPAIIAAVTFVLVALLDALAVLSAVVVAALGPLSLLAVLLGGLGAAFVIAGKKALEGHGRFAAFADKVSALGGQFSALGRTLAGRFLPYFWQLADAAQTALNYLNRIAKLPLKQAFHSLATEGVKMFSDFVYHVANVLKKPFRLAIAIAFGQGGQNAQAALGSWWNSLTNYLFGYQKSHPIELRPGVFKVETKTVQGALQPIIDWFNGQHFVDTGIRWAHDIIDGVVNLWMHDKKFRDAVEKIMADAGHVAGEAFKATLKWELNTLKEWLVSWAKRNWKLIFAAPVVYAQQAMSIVAGIIRNHLGAAWNAVKSRAASAWRSISAAASNAWSTIQQAVSQAANKVGNALGRIKSIGAHAFDAISGAVQGVIGWVENLIGKVQSLVSALSSIHFPSVPGGGLLGGVTKHIPGFADGGVVPGPMGSPQLILAHGGETVLPTHKQTGSSAHGAIAPVVMNFYGFDDATIKTAADKLQRHMNRSTARRA